MLGQFLGAFIGAAVLYLEYAQFISSNGGIEAQYGIFASYPADYLTNEFYWVSDQVLGTAILLIIINAGNFLTPYFYKQKTLNFIFFSN